VPDGRLLAGRAPAEAGLTLLEVLGAVALLAILYTALAGDAIEGLRSEGESRRRLEASLLADERLAEIELSLASGVVPPIGSAEAELEGFRVVTEVKPLELPPRPKPDAARGEPTSLAARRAAAQSEEREVPSLFAPPRSGTAPALLAIEIAVRWEEGVFERELRRATYALDSTAVEAAFGSVAPQPAGEPPQESLGEELPGRQERRNARSRRGSRGQPLPDFEIPLQEELGDPP
jgi:hypothetical protein